MNRKDNSGALFKNTKKEKDTHPDATGSAMIEGTEYYVSGWWNLSKSGDRYWSLSFTRKDEAKKASRPEPKAEAPYHDDPLPW